MAHDSILQKPRLILALGHVPVFQIAIYRSFKLIYATMALRLGFLVTGLPLALAFAPGADARGPGAEGTAAAFGVAFRFLGVTR